jgi:hypothetical protein
MYIYGFGLYIAVDARGAGRGDRDVDGGAGGDGGRGGGAGGRS